MFPFTPYTFGSMSLGRNPADIRSDLAVARRALEAGVWFHSSPTYNMGFTIGGTASLAHLEELLNAARDADPLSKDVLDRIEALQVLA